MRDSVTKGRGCLTAKNATRSPRLPLAKVRLNSRNDAEEEPKNDQPFGFNDPHKAVCRDSVSANEFGGMI